MSSERTENEQAVKKRRGVVSEAAEEEAVGGSSSRSAIAERSRCPALPFELIREIVRLVSLRDAEATPISTARLRELASISKSWNAAARPELFRTFTLGSMDPEELRRTLPVQLERWEFLASQPDLRRLVREVDLVSAPITPVTKTCEFIALTFPHTTSLCIGAMINKTYEGDAAALALNFPRLQMLTLCHYAFMENRVPAAADFARMLLHTVSLSGGRATLANILGALGATPSALTIQTLSLECNDVDVVSDNPDVRPLMLSPFLNLHTINFEMNNDASTGKIYPTKYLHTGESCWRGWTRGSALTTGHGTDIVLGHHPHLHTMRMRLFGVTDLTMELLRRTYARGNLPALRILEWWIRRAGAVSALHPTWIQFHDAGPHAFEPFSVLAEDDVQPRILPETLEAGLDALRIDVACGMVPEDVAHVESLFGVKGRSSVLILRNGACTNAEPRAQCSNRSTRHLTLDSVP
jgi:hypothetical protein